MNIRPSRNLLITIWFVVLLWVLSSVSFGSDKMSDTCPTKFKEFFSLLPPKVGEYEKVATFESFSPLNLFNYMNGNAPYYLDYGILCLGVQQYRKDKKAILLELFEFTNQNGARKIFSEETASNKNNLNIGEKGSYENCYLAFYHKSHFVKLMCFNEWQGNGPSDKSNDIHSNDYLKELAISIEAVLIQQTEGYLESNKEGKSTSTGQDLNKKDNIIVLIGASYAKGWILDEVAGMRVLNKGISGEQSFEMLSRFHEDVISVKPKAVIIWGFINDIHRSKREKISLAIERVKKSYIEMVKIAKDNKIVPILATEVTIRAKDSWSETLASWAGGLLGKKSYQDYVNQHVMEVNQWLKDYAEQQKLLLLDLQPVISRGDSKRKKEYATEDGTHISDAGYSALTDYSKKTLKGYFNLKK